MTPLANQPPSSLPLGGDFKLSRIGQISIPVADLQRAIRFYQFALGLPLLFATDRMAFFDADGQRLLLGLPEPAENQPMAPRPGSILYFTVSDIRRGFQALVERGAHIRQAPHLVARLHSSELWMTFFDDSEGNLLALMSEIAPESHTAGQ